jgi:hypothetical protein
MDLAQFMRIGDILGTSARDKPPLAPGLGMLLNEADNAVSKRWRSASSDPGTDTAGK